MDALNKHHRRIIGLGKVTAPVAMVHRVRFPGYCYSLDPVIQQPAGIRWPQAPLARFGVSVRLVDLLEYLVALEVDVRRVAVDIHQLRHARRGDGSVFFLQSLVWGSPNFVHHSYAAGSLNLFLSRKQ